MLNTIYKKQSIQFWLLNNPRCAVEVRHQVRWWINVWCGTCKNRLIKAAFYKGAITESQFLELLKDLTSNFIKVLLFCDLQNEYLQYNDVPQLKLSSVERCIWDTFQQQVIGYCSCVETAPCSFDLNPLDFFCGYTSNRECMQPLFTMFLLTRFLVCLSGRNFVIDFKLTSR